MKYKSILFVLISWVVTFDLFFLYLLIRWKVLELLSLIVVINHLRLKQISLLVLIVRLHFEYSLHLLQEFVSEFMRWLHWKVCVLSDEMGQKGLSVHFTSLLNVPLAQIIDKTHQVDEVVGGRTHNEVVLGD